MDRDILEVLESVIQQRCGIHINLRTIGTQRNTYKFSSVSFGISNKGVQGSLCEAGFSSGTAFIKIIPLRKHFVVVAKPTQFSADICGRNTVGIGLTNFAEGGIGISSLSDQRHIMGGCIMIFIRQSVGIGKMGIGTS